MIAVKGECQIIYKCQIVNIWQMSHGANWFGGPTEISVGKIWHAGRQLKIIGVHSSEYVGSIS